MRSLWQAPWGYPEAVFSSFGLVATGILIQEFGGQPYIRGPVYPYSAFALGFCVLFIFLVGWFFRKNQLVEFCASIPMTVSVVTLFCIFSIIAGVLPQDNFSLHWPKRILTSWPYLISLLMMVINLGLSVALRLKSFTKKDITFFCVHLGIFVIVLTMTVGARDFKRVKVFLEEGGMTRVAYNEGDTNLQFPISLPFALELKQFTIEFFEKEKTPLNPQTKEPLHRPKLYQSTLRVFVKGEPIREVDLIVNRPYKIAQYKLYQAGYEIDRPNKKNLSFIDLIYDPWLPYVYFGIFLLTLGITLFLWTGLQNLISKIESRL